MEDTTKLVFTVERKSDTDGTTSMAISTESSDKRGVKTLWIVEFVFTLLNGNDISIEDFVKYSKNMTALTGKDELASNAFLAEMKNIVGELDPSPEKTEIKKAIAKMDIVEVLGALNTLAQFANKKHDADFTPHNEVKEKEAEFNAKEVRCHELGEMNDCDQCSELKAFAASIKKHHPEI